MVKDETLAVAAVMGSKKNPFEKQKKRLRWWCKCSVITGVIMTIFLATGIALIYLFNKYLDTDDNKKVGAYIGIVCVLIGALGFILAITICCCLYRIVRSVDNAANNAGRKLKFEHSVGDDGLLYPSVVYPRQKMEAMPTAPPPTGAPTGGPPGGSPMPPQPQ